ncbi:MAG: hypothetical protein C9356_11895 [Oleiphilus sp.]|nr:MAG: hypothetical protein C9356_11895 [Oleiphilus sp.]
MGQLVEFGPRKTAQLNDALRKDPFNRDLGQFVVTPGIMDLGPLDCIACIDAMRAFDDFSEKRDPWGEHDGAIFPVRLSTGETKQVMFKIDYFDPSMTYLSENPANSTVTRRVLTLMFASDY